LSLVVWIGWLGPPPASGESEKQVSFGDDNQNGNGSYSSLWENKIAWKGNFQAMVKR
jgi:hypothetical protein